MAQQMLEFADIECEVNPIITEQYGAPAPSLRYSVLDN